MTLTVQLIDHPTLISTITTYIRIIPTNISPNLVAYGTSMITRGIQQDIIFNPGQYSVDPDEDTFDATVRFHSSPSQDVLLSDDFSSFFIEMEIHILLSNLYSI